MINLFTGEIHFVHSNFVLSPSLDRSRFEKLFPEKFINYNDVGTGYYHYGIACDIRKDEYIYTRVCFHNQTLWFVKFFPQNSSKNLQGLDVSIKEYDVTYPACQKWFQDVFLSHTSPIVFPWGTIKLLPGLPKDPLYGQPFIYIEYCPIP